MSSVTSPINLNAIPKIDGIPVVEFAKNAIAFSSSNLPQHLLAWWKTYGAVFRIPMPGVQMVVFSEEKLIKEMLLNHKVFAKGPLFKGLRDLLGESVLIEDGDHWLLLRRIINRAFGDLSNDLLNQTFAEQTAQMTQSWTDGSSVNLFEQTNHIALNIMWKLMFLADRDPAYKQAMSEAFVTCVKFLNRGAMIPLPQQFMPGYGDYKAANSLLTQVFDSLLHETVENSSSESETITKILVDAYGSHDVAIAQLKTLVLAGHETTQISLSWILYHIAEDPALQEALKAEIRANYQEGKPLADAQFPLLVATITESLRLWPATFIIPRQTTEPVALGPYQLPAGVMTIGSTMLAHRDPIFHNAQGNSTVEDFDPYRFINNPNLYLHTLSFGHGPRKCLGANFAMEESKQIVAYLLSHFTLKSTGQKPIPFNVGGIIRPNPAPVVTVERA